MYHAESESPYLQKMCRSSNAISIWLQSPDFASRNSRSVPPPYPRWSPELHPRPHRHGTQAAHSGHQRALASGRREAHGPVRAPSCNLGWVGLLRKGQAFFFFSFLWSLNSEGGLGLQSAILPAHATSEGRQQEDYTAEHWRDAGSLRHCFEV